MRRTCFPFKRDLYIPRLFLLTSDQNRYPSCISAANPTILPSGCKKIKMKTISENYLFKKQKKDKNENKPLTVTESSKVYKKIVIV